MFLLRSSFFRAIRPLASSDATAYYRPAPGRTDGIPPAKTHKNRNARLDALQSAVPKKNARLYGLYANWQFSKCSIQFRTLVHTLVSQITEILCFSSSTTGHTPSLLFINNLSYSLCSSDGRNSLINNSVFSSAHWFTLTNH